ncbi:MAG: hypothetical protein P8M30_15325 [Planctomycetaceae bacterium]|nr:hypothetical protein [Planctomycetaceae bacterium]
MKFHKSPIAKGLVCTAAGSMFLFQASGFSLSSVEAQQKTSIQQELEKLYQQEGRQAPSMELKTLPRDTIDGRVFQESANPGQPPQSVSPQQRQSQPPVRQVVPATQTSATYDARDRQNTVESPAPKKRGLLNRMKGFDRLMFWKKDKQKNMQLSKEAVAETPVTSQPEARRPTAYQPPAVPAAAPPVDYPTTQFQRPVQNRPTASRPQALPALQQSAPIRSAKPFPASQSSPPQRTATLPPVPTRTGQMPVIIPQGQDRSTQAVPTASPVTITIPQQSPVASESENGLPPAPAAFGSLEVVQPVSQPQPVVEQPKALPIVETPVVESPVSVKGPVTTVVEQPKPQAAAKLPSLDELPKEPVPIIPEAEPEAPPMVDEFFPDPFTEISEDKADLSKEDMEIPDIRMDMNETPSLQPIPETTEDAAPALPEVEENKTPVPQPMPVTESPEATPEAQLLEDENPFSGLKLEEPSATLPMDEADQGSKAAPSLPVDAVPALPIATEEAPSAAPALPDLNPAFEDEFQLPVKKETSEEPIPEMPILGKIPEAIPELPGVEQGDISWEVEEAHRTSKLDLIADREGETGLKGFCIVALRDNRDLIDALPSFRSTYNLRTYHFSSLELKIEFDKDPRKYVPAYDGNDPILLSTQSEEREGSLDYALWFKGRLYLFTTHDNLTVFQLDPVLYAEN